MAVAAASPPRPASVSAASLLLVAAAGLTLLAVFNRRGSGTARIKPVTRVTHSIAMLALLAAMVLLGLPSAHRFFRTAATAARPVP